MVDNEVEIDLLREFRVVNELLVEKFSFAIDFSMKGRTNLLTS